MVGRPEEFNIIQSKNNPMTEVKKGKSLLGSKTINIVLMLIIIVIINVIAAGLYFRLDITDEKLYTLSSGTIKIVEKIETPVTIKYYFTKNIGSLPLAYKNYGKKIDELLHEFQNLNPEKISLEVYDPKPDSDEEEWAQKYGITGIDLNSQDRLYLGMVVIQEDKEFGLPVMDPRREQYLEYDITQLFLQLTQKSNKKLGIMSSLPVMGVTANRYQQMQGQRSSPKWVFVEELEKTFEVQEVKPTEKEIDPKISILMVIHPKKLSENALYAIDQFVLRGGELIVLVDPNARVDSAAAMMAQMGQMPQASSNLDKLFKHWGVEYKANSILGDKDRSTTVNAGASMGAVPFSLWHSISKDSFDQELIATKELDHMLLIEPGGFNLSEKSPLTLQPLINSSKNSGLIESYIVRFSDPLKINKQIKGDGKVYSLAGILTGELTSAFESKPEEKPTEEQKAENKDDMTLKTSPHRRKSVKSAKILLITDVDFIADQFSVEKFNLLGQTFSQPRNDNLNFLVNMVEFLGGSEDLMSIRSRGRFSRPFTRFLELEKEAQKKYQQAEESISLKLKEVQAKLNTLNVQKGTNKIVLTKEQIEKVQQFRKEEKKTKNELRKIRKLLRQDIEAEKTKLTLLNLLAIPILTVLLGLFLYYRRSQQKFS